MPLRGKPWSRDWRGLRRRGLLTLAVLLGVFIGVSGYTFHYAKGGSYLSANPDACINCHIMREQHETWTKSSHHAVATCNDCHIPHAFPWNYIVKMENGYVHSAAFTLQNFHEPIQIRPRNLRVLESNCLHCHGEVVSHALGADAREGDGRACVSCHATVGHAAVR